MQGNVFRRDWLNVTLGAFRELLGEEQAMWPDTAAGVLGFGLRNRARLRFGPNPLRVLGKLPLHLPGSTRAFWETVVRVPVPMRADGAMHMALLGHLAPVLLRVPVASGAKLVAPSPVARRLLRRQRLSAAFQRALQNRPRLRDPLHRLGLPVPFQWQGSVAGLRWLRRALTVRHVYEAPVLEERLRGSIRLEPTDAPFFPLVARERAVAHIGRAAAGS